MSEESWIFKLDGDKPKCDRGKVPNSDKKCFIQGHSGIVIPYAFYLFVQSGKVSPNHECETGDGDTPGVEMVFDKLVLAVSTLEGQKAFRRTQGKLRATYNKLAYKRHPNIWSRRHPLQIT